MFGGYYSNLDIMSRIILSAMKKDDLIFDFDLVEEFPIIGKGKYFSVLDEVIIYLIFYFTKFYYFKNKYEILNIISHLKIWLNRMILKNMTILIRQLLLNLGITAFTLKRRKIRFQML